MFVCDATNANSVASVMAHKALAFCMWLLMLAPDAQLALGGQPPSLTKPLPFTLRRLRREGVCEGVCEGGDPLHTPHPSPVKGVTLSVKPPPFTLNGEPRSLCCGTQMVIGMSLTNSDHI
jgi:hypothetical protein